MSEFVLTAVETPPKEWTGDHGTFHIYTVQFKGDQGEGTAQIKQKASSPAPTEGQTLDAEIVHKREGLPPELKRIYQNRNGGGSKKGGGDYRSPEQIMRSFAHSHALKWLEIKAGMGKLEEALDWPTYQRLVSQFYGDVKDIS